MFSGLPRPRPFSTPHSQPQAKGRAGCSPRLLTCLSTAQLWVTTQSAASDAAKYIFWDHTASSQKPHEPGTILLILLGLVLTPEPCCPQGAKSQSWSYLAESVWRVSSWTESEDERAGTLTVQLGRAEGFISLCSCVCL